MEIPKNCRECEHTNSCTTPYGWSRCKYKDEIRETINKTIDKKEEKHHGN